ncbi:glycosyltransferase family 2 protein [Candidatus Sumerlaeota bacterium]|nr:glycosyltransferase family 2 protein [Candidatus Sumerlaeota bacterium]
MPVQLLSIIIPAYNEQNRLPQTLERIAVYLHEQEFDSEVLVVDDGSTDETVKRAEQFVERMPGALRVLRNQGNRGKGYSTRRGMLEAQGAWRLFTDADLSTPIEELDAFLKLARDGANVVIGSRALPQSQVEVRQNWLRQTMGRTFNKILHALALRGIKDTQCGFKLFSAEAAQAIFSKAEVDGFAFDVEALLLARKLGYAIIEQPVRWINSPDSKVSIVRDSAKMLWDVLALRWRLR